MKKRAPVKLSLMQRVAQHDKRNMDLKIERAIKSYTSPYKFTPATRASKKPSGGFPGRTVGASAMQLTSRYAFYFYIFVAIFILVSNFVNVLIILNFRNYFIQICRLGSRAAMEQQVPYRVSRRPVPKWRSARLQVRFLIFIWLINQSIPTNEQLVFKCHDPNRAS